MMGQIIRYSANLVGMDENEMSLFSPSSPHPPHRFLYLNYESDSYTHPL